ncbi:zinc-binding dehydrogenase [Peribacillus frigoritolerans]|uniref:alcohol dehydrogenase catalytic domain-containing protein n=1 Tax=Peribacillus frigoritolerans TaxID=450367 RepID=UPI00207AFF28|nr:zinc-binding dehydrogenase [Peribacillus frigoritolerans]USK82987.1 zinc-binding dehydrogenase [Peribacillus frigoritolerans]WJE50232.1 zinc-binding dehydrogenase [Peribacillus frigoritolerans]
MKMMKAIQIPSKEEKMKLVEIPVPQPGEGQVLLRVEACGVCNGDSMAIQGGSPEYPRIPGHEVIGVVEELGTGSTKWKIGERVGIGWHGGNNHVTGLTMDGGYAEYMVAYEDSLSSIPNELSALEAAPLMCAGETTFSALRNSKARPGDLVAIQGIGGLGHLAVQYAKKAGFRTVAISRGNDKEKLVRQLGAHYHIDSEKEDPAQALQALGGAKVILATAPNAKAISSLINGLGSDSELIIIAGSGEQLELSAMDFLKGPNTVRGSFTGQAKEIQEAVNFSILTDVRPMIETFPLERANEAYDKMMAASTRFRAVLKISE